MIEKSLNPFRISLGNRRVYTTFAIELKTLNRHIAVLTELDLVQSASSILGRSSCRPLVK
jgi:hypothetical protein